MASPFYAPSLLRYRAIYHGVRFLEAMVTRYIDSYVHNGKIGVLVELECRDDFTTRTKEFQMLIRDLAMQIAASDPVDISPEDYSSVVPISGGDSYEIDEDSFLLKKPFIKDPTRTVEQVIQQVASELGESIRVVRFIRHATEEI